MKKIEVPVLKSFTVGDVKVNVDAILNCPFEDIREAAEKIPAYIGWFGHQKACAAERLINAEFKYKQVEARAYNDLKNNGQFTAKGFGEKMTEEALKRAVVLMPEVEEAKARQAKAEKDLEWTKSYIDALKAKFELVRSSEATRRMEHEHDRTHTE